MRVCFFTTSDFSQVLREQYTYSDYRILSDLGFDVHFSSRLSDIPFNCDLYYSWWASGSVWPWFISVISGKPNVVVAGGNEAISYVDSISNQPHGYLANGLLKKIATRLVLRYSDSIIAVSEYMVAGLMKLGAKQPVVVHNCVDTDLFCPNEFIHKEFVTTSFKLDYGPTLIKRGENFIRAASLVHRQFSNIKFLVIGHKGTSYSFIDQLARDLGLSDVIIFTGSINNTDVVKYLQRSLSFVQPSDTETFGVAVAEAMSVGCPVVLSRCGALPELASGLAVYVDHNSPESIASGIVDVLKMTQSDRLIIGAQCRQRIINNFSYSKRKEALAKIIFGHVLKDFHDA
jgi:glycosyltransferase involved in cell wall biosynthesis